jgi:hypothetical protein
MQKPRYIYALSDPETNDVKYIGATVNPLKRAGEHRAEGGRRGSRLSTWLEALRLHGVHPLLTIIEKADGAIWPDREAYWIQVYRARGYDLLNQSDGGDGPSGLDTDRWARDYAACISCNRTDRIHAAGGLCTACYNRVRHRQRTHPDRPYLAWSLDHPCCVDCGRTDRRHKGGGRCEVCHARERTRQKQERDAKRLPRWAPGYDACKSCGLTSRRHNAHGLCTMCYRREREGRTTWLLPGAWSKHYPACTGCGRTDREHASGGLCRTCYMQAWRQR